MAVATAAVVIAGAKAVAEVGIATASFLAGDQMEKDYQDLQRKITVGNDAAEQADASSERLQIRVQESQQAIQLNASTVKKGQVGLGNEAEKAEKQADYAARARRIQLKLNLAQNLQGSEQRRQQGKINLAGSVLKAAGGFASAATPAGGTSTPPTPNPHTR